MMLTGKTIDAKRAKRMGLADDAVPPRVMEQAARHDGIVRRNRGVRCRCCSGCSTVRSRAVVASGARKQVARKARPQHYPAPYAIIDIWAKYNGNALAAPELVDGIISSPTARNLVRVFFLQERLKAFGKDSELQGRTRPCHWCRRHGWRHCRLVRLARHDSDLAGPEPGTHCAGLNGPGENCSPPPA
jgi:3-hydroxyacyl-CoA dehydrogenase/enoyl-CoA hydratase/3-hydroxybutyryl-CoA epimerase